MYNVNEEKDAKLFSELMSEIKQINKDWITLRNSKQYKLGLIWFEIFDNIKRFKIKMVIKSIHRWINGIISKKIKSNMNKSKEIETNSNYFSNERIAIYTAVFGNYDKVLEPYFVPDNCDFYIFTDQEIDNSKSIWKKREIPDNISSYSNIEKNRYLKMHPHEILGNYKYSIYIDGNVQIMTDLTEYINCLNEIGIGIHMHDMRNCVYDELKVICKNKKDSKENVKKHIQYLLDTNMPKNYGLLQCNVIAREHNNSNCISIMNDWWEEFSNYSRRDQISLPHVLFMHDIPIEKVGVIGKNIYKNPSFRILNHK